MSNDANSIGSAVITGGKGFAGRHLARELTTAWPSNQVQIWDLPDVDILEPTTYQAELERLQPTWVVHLAALAAVGSSFVQPERVQEVNVRGTERLLETIQQISPTTHVLAISSSDIYGLAASERHGTPIPELTLADCRPRNPYAASKLAMEHMLVERFKNPANGHRSARRNIVYLTQLPLFHQ